MLFYVFSTVFAILYSVVTLPIIPFIPISLRIYICVVGIRVLLFFCRVFDGITYEIIGRENMPEGPFIVASAHQSPLETLVFTAELRGVVFILKKELRLLPIIGIFMMSIGMIFIDRNKKVSALRKIVRECMVKSKEKRTIVIFPEGTTRNRSQRDWKYHEGVAMIYEKLQIPVVPVALNTGLYWPPGVFSLSKKRGKATLKILPPIAPGMSKEKFMESLKLSISEGSKCL